MFLSNYDDQWFFTPVFFKEEKIQVKKTKLI